MSGRSVVRTIAVTALAGAALVGGAGVASAHDHLAGAAGSSGVEERAFTNPVAGNPSDTSGAAARPGTVPGLGDPKIGIATNTPAFSCSTLLERLAGTAGSGPGCE